MTPEAAIADRKRRNLQRLMAKRRVAGDEVGAPRLYWGWDCCTDRQRNTDTRFKSQHA